MKDDSCENSFNLLCEIENFLEKYCDHKCTIHEVSYSLSFATIVILVQNGAKKQDYLDSINKLWNSIEKHQTNGNNNENK